MSQKDTLESRQEIAKELFAASLLESEVISFDVFDTLIYRRYSHPKHLFIDLSKQLAEIGINISAEERILGEQQARKKIKLEDVTLQEIWETILVNSDEEFDIQLAISKEIELEINSTFPNQLGVDLVSSALSANKKIIAVSDIYLPGKVIESILTKSGYAQIPIFSSSDIRLTKATGSIWGFVTRKINTPPNLITHVGDNLHSDVSNPKRLGIRTIHFPSHSAEHKSHSPIYDEILPYSLLRQSLLYQHHQMNPLTPRLLGGSFGLIFFGGYLKWLEKNLPTNVKGTIFVTREGDFLLNAAKTLKLNLGNTKLLALSRRVLRAASLVNLSQSSLEAFLEPGIESFRTLSSIFKLFEIGIESQLAKDLLIRFHSPEAKLYSQDLVEIATFLMDNYAESTRSFGREKLRFLHTYLKSEGIDSGTWNFVEVGWHGSMQRDIRLHFESFGMDVRFNGFYIGLHAGAGANRFKSGPMFSFISSDFSSQASRRLMHEATDLLELLLSAPYGSLTRYKPNQFGSVVPEFAPCEFSIEQLNFVSEFQAGFFESVDRIHKNGMDLGKILDDERESAKAALIDLVLFPSDSEIDLLANLRQFPNIDHESNSYILGEPPLTYTESGIHEVLNYWGSLRARKLINEYPDLRERVEHSTWNIQQLHVDQWRLHLLREDS